MNIKLLVMLGFIVYGAPALGMLHNKYQKRQATQCLQLRDYEAMYGIDDDISMPMPQCMVDEQERIIRYKQQKAIYKKNDDLGRNRTVLIFFCVKSV